MAILDTSVVSGFDRVEGEPLSQCFEREGNALKALQETSDALPPGNYVGALLAFPVADGKALYVVTKESPLTVQLVPFGDSYQIPRAHLKGLDLDDVEQQLAYAKAVKNLFSART